jgi:hypothetical protein
MTFAKTAVQVKVNVTSTFYLTKSHYVGDKNANNLIVKSATNLVKDKNDSQILKA